jgi:hypothetical protein
MIIGRISYVDEKNKISVEDYLKNNKVIYRFVRNVHGQPRGLVCAIGPGRIGWSKLHWLDVGKWNKHDALTIAIRRAMSPGKLPVDKQFVDVCASMVERADKYYKIKTM